MQPLCKDSFWRLGRKIFIANTLIALAILAIMAVFAPETVARNFWAYLFGNFVFSQCIGTLAASTAPLIAIGTVRFKPYIRWPLYMTVLAGIAILGTIAANVVLATLDQIRWENFWLRVAIGSRIAIIATIILGTVAYIIEDLRARFQRSTLELRTQQLERERAQKLAMEAQLNSLQSRLQPHFLFNTINSVLALIREDPSRAEQMLERLSRLLRYALDSQQRPLVSVGEEVRLLRDYLEIEETRFGSRLHFSIHIEPGTDSFKIPPYSLQTLVENSMKYAVAPRIEGGSIEIRTRLVAAGVELQVSDDGPGFSRDDIREGHGIDTLEKRMAVLYGGQPQLLVEGNRVSLICPQEGGA